MFSKIISFEDNLILPDFFGSNDENLKKLENAFGVSILPRGNYLKIELEGIFNDLVNEPNLEKAV